MITSTTKLIAALAIAAGLLTTNGALAKGPSKSSGSGSNHRQIQKSSKNFSAFKLRSNNLNSNIHFNNNKNFISKKNFNLSPVFKKQDFHKDYIHSNSFKTKDFFCKKDNKGWFDLCHPKHYCYPYNFGYCFPSYGCYYPTYYCTPTYSSYGYNSGNITVLQNVQPSRTPVAVGSTLMVNGQAFGDKAGGARLRISGMAMPIEVLEWTPASVTVRLPQIEITDTTPAEIEVVRDDGSLASKMAIALTASPEQLALGR